MSRMIVCAMVGPADGDELVRFAGDLSQRMDVPLALVDVRRPVPPPYVPPAEGPQPLVVPTSSHAAGVAAVESSSPGTTDPPLDLTAVAGRAGVRPARSESVIDEPAHALRELSQRPETELLVVSDGGGGPVTAKLADNAARGMLRDASCPVVLVPRGADRPPVPDRPRLACGVDEGPAGVAVAGFAGRLAHRLGASLRIVHVGGDEPKPAPNSQLEPQCLAAVPRAVDASFERVTGAPSDEMPRIARAAESDLVVVGAPGHGWLAAALLGSVAHDTLRDGDTPIVVVPEGQSAG